MSVLSYAETYQTSMISSIYINGEKLPPSRFVDEVNLQMVCLMCEMVSPDPVYLLCCHTKYYCRKCLIVDRHQPIMCPSCQVPANVKTVTRNDTLRNAIYNLKAQCEYASVGCKALYTIDQITDHVDTCVYQPTNCENKGCFEAILLKNWVQHCKMECPKRQVQCLGSCSLLITAGEIDTHDCDGVLKDLIDYQQSETNILLKLFKEQHELHMSLLRKTSSEEITKKVNERLLLRQVQENVLEDNMRLMRDNMRHMLLAEDKTHDELGHVIHNGDWRCSVFDCELPHSKHDYSKKFSDGKRHIFFWDCCLSGDGKSKKCEDGY